MDFRVLIWLFLFLPVPASLHATEKPLPTEERSTAGEPPGEKEEPKIPANAFEAPGFLEEYRKLQVGVALAFQRRNPTAAENFLLRAIELSPFDAGDRYNLACARAQAGKHEEALAALEESVTLGFHDANHMMADGDLRPLYPYARFHAQVARARWLSQTPPTFPRTPPGTTPTEVSDGVALVSDSNTAFLFRQGVFQTAFSFPESLSQESIATGMSKARRLLRSWQEEGTAAGNVGDLYDNWDRDHSNLDYAQFPQLTRVEYSSDAKRAGLGMGIQLQVFHNAITLGNSSTAQVGSVFWRSQPRGAYTRPGGATILHAQYRSNHLYLYPEHRDHDPGHNGKEGFGDVFPANTPYVVISQGSSGSDRPFLEAFAATLAAFRPEVKAALRDQGLLMPTMQMIFRGSNRNVADDSDYLSGKAHPTVFDALQLDAKRMVEKAHAILPGQLPPLVQLTVIEEDESPGTPGEILFSTPQALARVFRTHRYSRRMTVSAEQSLCPQGSDLTYEWVVLRGDENRIRIVPQNDEASIVEIEIPYHERSPTLPGSEISSNRVDIGVFVRNEFHLSAPAFLSTMFLDNETRIYDAENRLLTLDGNDPETRDNYVDPLIAPLKRWRDEFAYDEKGNLTGWTRHHPDRVEEFTATGKRIVKDPETGKVELQSVVYTVQSDEPGKTHPRWEVVAAGERPSNGKPDEASGSGKPDGANEKAP